MRKLAMSLTALALGGVAAYLPTVAVSQSGATPQVTAQDFQFASGTQSSNPTIDIQVGGSVSFSYPSGTSTHNVDFSTPPAQVSCNGSPAPFPSSPQGQGWSGTCVFTTAGTYMFHCDHHPFMTGTVIVSGSTSTGSTGTSGTTGGTGTSGNPPGTPPGAPSPGGGSTTPAAGNGAPALDLASAARSLHFAAHQRGTQVAGSLTSPGAGVDVVVTLLSGHTVVGRLARTTTNAPTLHFTVALSSAGRRSLRRHHRLTLTVRVSLSAPGSTSRSTTRTVTLAS